jgi:hypothetical protein
MNSVSAFLITAGGEKFHLHITLTEMVSIKYCASGNSNGFVRGVPLNEPAQSSNRS